MENINAFTILPMSQRFQLKAGETTKGSIKIVNPADATEDFSYKVSVSPYGVAGEDYEADLVTDSEHTAIAKWIKISEPTGTIKPNETKEVEFTIEVPADAPAGGQYAAIAVSSDNATEQGSGVAVQNVFEMASIVYGTVAGESHHEGEVLENNIPGFVVAPPVTLSALINNEGNVHADATFVIAVSDFFSGRVILPTEEDEGEYSEIIMPDTTRRIEREVSNLPSLGAVKISQTIYYNGVATPQEKVVIICPIWFLALVIATIVAIITTIVRIVIKHKKHKRVDV
ncbi:hypothetical protein IJG93_02275 [Candidatus Saccharibacteria bacterium]|nr:hypothetical protein [Candidatus Saccharibacteria bacterium]MBQ3436482.1 hypothetical protein [Candidatus Saccharibacteria bacterium]